MDTRTLCRALAAHAVLVNTDLLVGSPEKTLVEVAEGWAEWIRAFSEGPARPAASTDPSPAPSAPGSAASPASPTAVSPSAPGQPSTPDPSCDSFGQEEAAMVRRAPEVVTARGRGRGGASGPDGGPA